MIWACLCWKAASHSHSSHDTCCSEKSECSDRVHSCFQLEEKTPTRHKTTKLDNETGVYSEIPLPVRLASRRSRSQTFTDPKNKRFLPGCVITRWWGAGTRACNVMPFCCVCLWREGVVVRGGRRRGVGGLCYNVIKIRWPPRDSVCYCLLNLKKMACKNRQAVEVLRLLRALFSESFPSLRRRRRSASLRPANCRPSRCFNRGFVPTHSCCLYIRCKPVSTINALSSSRP